MFGKGKSIVYGCTSDHVIMSFRISSRLIRKNIITWYEVRREYKVSQRISPIFMSLVLNSCQLLFFRRGSLLPMRLV